MREVFPKSLIILFSKSGFQAQESSRDQSTVKRKFSERAGAEKVMVGRPELMLNGRGLSGCTEHVHMVLHVLEGKKRKNQSLVTLHHLKICQILSFSGFVQCNQASLSS